MTYRRVSLYFIIFKAFSETVPELSVLLATCFVAYENLLLDFRPNWLVFVLSGELCMTFAVDQTKLFVCFSLSVLLHVCIKWTLRVVGMLTTADSLAR